MWVINHDFAWAFFSKDCLKRTAVKRLRKIKVRTKVSSDCNVDTDVTPVTLIDTQRQK